MTDITFHCTCKQLAHVWLLHREKHACKKAPAEIAVLAAGFEQAVKDSNQSELGRRNGGSMVSVQASERALLCYLMNRLHILDPDVLVGHNVSAFDLDILLHRLQHHKVPC